MGTCYSCWQKRSKPVLKEQELFDLNINSDYFCLQDGEEKGPQVLEEKDIEARLLKLIDNQENRQNSENRNNPKNPNHTSLKELFLFSVESDDNVFNPTRYSRFYPPKLLPTITEETEDFDETDLLD